MITYYNYKKVDKGAPREGKFGTGHRIRYLCAFCLERFRSRRERVQHAAFCREHKSEFYDERKASL